MLKEKKKLRTTNEKIIKVKKQKSKGITLIALVITIIVLLILAGVTIATLTGDNGILTRASEAKIETALGTVKEALRLEQMEKKIDDEEVNPETLLANGKVQRTVQQGEDGNYYMYYALKEDSYEGMQGLGKGNLSSLKDVFLIDDDLNVKYISSSGKEYGDDINNKILEDETEIRFASEAFSEYVSKISGVSEEEMKFKWMKNQTSLTIDDASITSLEDLVFFPNLVELVLTELKLENLNGIENCLKLETFSSAISKIKDFNKLSYLFNLKNFNNLGGENDFDNIINALKDLSNLEIIYISHLNITSINSLEKLSTNKLKQLSLDYNQIQTIEVLNNMTNLEGLNLNNNKITSIEGIENLTNLKTLTLSNNLITDITPLSANTSLTTLDLIGNIGIDGNRNNYTGEKLEALNKIGEILDRGGTIYLDIDKLGLFTNYNNLNLSNQNLTTLEPLEGLTKLTSLNLEYNNIALEDENSQEILQSMTNLTNLNLSYNKVTNLKAINSLKHLKYLYLVGNDNVDLSDIEDIISSLNVLNVSTNAFKTITNCDTKKITQLNLTSSNLNDLTDLSDFNNLIQINLTNNKNIKDFNQLSKITSLQRLILSNNDLHGKMIDFSKLTNLSFLSLSGNTLWSEDLEKLKTLKNNTELTIDLSNNSIIDATALLELNSNTKIDLRNNINLSQDSKDKLKARFGSNVTF